MTFAFGAGLLATVNPCGFVMLPGFIGMQLGAQEGTADRTILTRCAQGVGIGLVLSGAFSAVLVLAGLAAGMRALVGAIPWLVVAVGLGLIVAGAAMLTGHRLGLMIASRLHPANSARHGYGRIAGFGAGYAVASLSCTLAVVLAVATQATATSNPVQVLGVFAAFAAGATSALLALSISIALAKGVIARTMRRIAPLMNTISATMLLASGVYLLVYWLPTLLGDDTARPGGAVGETIEGASATLANFLAAHTGAFAIGLALAVAAGVALTAARRLPTAPIATRRAHAQAPAQRRATRQRRPPRQTG
jgi:cytochrome c-type biogenesis protein